MIGAIAGDIIGSVYEFRAMKTRDFTPLFHPEARFTDDTVLTVAVADALMHDLDVVQAFKSWGRRYPDSCWGDRFVQWLFSDDTEPYGSYGNGAAMRVSAAAWLGRDMDEALSLGARVTRVTHNHPEGMKGAAAVVCAAFLARQGHVPGDIREEIASRFGYDLSHAVEEIRPTYRFNETCQGSVPEALTCALEAKDYEDAVRNAVSLGGDADTLGAIAGTVAEARFGVPTWVACKDWERLTAVMRAVVSKFYGRCGLPVPWVAQD